MLSYYNMKGKALAQICGHFKPPKGSSVFVDALIAAHGDGEHEALLAKPLSIPADDALCMLDSILIEHEECGMAGFEIMADDFADASEDGSRIDIAAEKSVFEAR